MKFFSLLYQGDLHLSDENKVIPSEDFSLLVKADEVLDKAKQDAKTLHAQTLEECERLKEQSKKEGFHEGLELFNEHILSLDRALRTLRMETQQQIIPLALTAAKKIVATQLELKPETIVDIVQQALSPITQHLRYTIYVNKADKEILEAHKSEIKDILEQVQLLKIQERADISRGGCIIETDAGIINATTENLWRAMQRAFEKYTRPQEG